MANRIMFLNIFRGHIYDTTYQEYIDSETGLDTEVDVRSFERGPKHLEYDHLHQLGLNRYETLTLADTLKMIKRAEEDGYDAAVIGCFNDPGLTEAREISENMVVTAPAEASMHIAATLGHRFSIVVSTKKDIPQMQENVAKYGFKDKLASFKSIELSVSDLQEDHKETARRLKEVCKQAIEQDMADVILLGCTNYFGFYRELQEYVDVPVIDPILAAFKFAEFLIELSKRFGWRYSKIYG